MSRVTIDKIEKYTGSTMMLTLGTGETVFVNAEIVTRYELKAGMTIPQAAL